MPIKGLWIVLEGIDGAGKSTLAAALAKTFEHQGRNVFSTFEPTNERYGQLFRARMKDHLRNGCEFDSREQLQVLFRDRMNHYAKIRLALDAGVVVIQDRFWPSTVAYQPFTRDSLIDMHQWMFWPGPDAMIIVDITPEDAIKRLASRGDDDDFAPLMRQAYDAYRYMMLSRPIFDYRVDAMDTTASQVKDIFEFLRTGKGNIQTSLGFSRDLDRQLDIGAIEPGMIEQLLN